MVSFFKKWLEKLFFWEGEVGEGNEEWDNR